MAFVVRRCIMVGALAALAVITAGCGGGGEASGGNPPTPPPPTSNDPPLVSGSETALISAVLTAAADSPVPAQDVNNGFLLSRLVVAFKSAATVGQVNAAARVVGATRITSAEPGSLLVVLAVPKQASVAAIQSLARTMRTHPGVVLAWPGQTAKTSVLPEFSPGVPASTISLSHLLANRFPQAWNARQTIAADCLPHSVSVYVTDVFGDPRTRPDFFQQVDRSSFIADPTSPQDGQGGHGYDVVSTLAAKFDADLPTGANPFDDCVLVQAREAADSEFVDVVRHTLHAVAADPESRVVLSFSINFADDGFCGSSEDQPCDATSVAALSHSDMTVMLLARVAAAVEWARLTRTLGLHDKMLVTQAAGNIDPEPGGFLARRYLGFRLAKLSSPAALATHLDEVRTLFTDASLWTGMSLPDFTFTADEADAFDEPALSPTNDIDAANLVIVDSGTSGETPSDVRQSEFDMLGADVRAVGEDVALSQSAPNGTSFAAPLAAGLAAYLWNLSPALLAQPASATADLLKQSSAHGAGSPTVLVLDAYAAVLRLDDVPGCCSGALPAPTRFGLMDVNGDGVFDALDLQKFVEAALSDLQILCYYAYSPIYFLDGAGQNEQLRSDLLGTDFCVGARINAQLPAQIASSGTLNAVVDVPDGHGAFAHAPNVVVDLSPNCATVSPTTGRTDTNGAISATVTPASGCTSVSVQVVARADPGTRPLAQQVVNAAVATGGSTCPAGSKQLSYILSDATEVKQIHNETLAQLTDTASDANSLASVTVGFGRIEERTEASKLHPLQFGNAGTHDGGAQNTGQFNDALIIAPADPTLLNRQGTVTASFRVDAESTVSGQRAQARWSLSSIFPLTFSVAAVRSTVTGQSSGDLTGGTYSATGRFTFGVATAFDVELRTSMRYECDFDGTCSVPSTDTGSGSIHATLHWQGITVRDPDGNQVPFSVCSVSGTDWAAAQ